MLARDLRTLRRNHSEVQWAGVYRAGRLMARSGPPAPGTDPAAVARRASASRSAVEHENRGRSSHVALLGTRTRDGDMLVLGYDLSTSDAALADRNRRVLLVLVALLAGFTLFTAVVLDRGVFRPLERMRAATNALRRGDLEHPAALAPARRARAAGARLRRDGEHAGEQPEPARGACADRSPDRARQPPRVPGVAGARHRPRRRRRAARWRWSCWTSTASSA